ncbi:non-heme iron oxygenase ferredoxin subunit [Sporichthya polymorpha]|uniref:non-heme iron oxygenase ferredoxin subunit n=1 Tax=Sporichthya polymorpha TaxID=35751 RepID=UPI00035DB463|nr:non-heme iron oxygenase ferredoxin subunit [Sporichthya polymorpha]
MGRVRACGVDDLADGGCMQLKAGPTIALFRVDGEFFATDDTCTHEDWSLGDDGETEGYEVICALHQARFDVRTGEATGFPATEPLKTYPVLIDDGQVWVEIGQ